MADGKTRADMRSLVRGVFNTKDKGPMLLLNLLRQRWPDVVGPELSARTWPQRLERGTLWIGAPDASWVYELQFFKGELLASVQTFLEQGGVTELRFRVGAVPDAAPTPETRRRSVTSDANAPPPDTEPRPGGNRFSRLAGKGDADGPTAPRSAPARGEGSPAETPERLAEAAQAIADPSLRAVFERSLAKQRRSRQAGEGKRTGDGGPNPKPDRSDER